MRRFLLDTGIAGDYIDRRRGVFEKARDEVSRGNRVGIGIPVLAELAYGIELSRSRDRNMQSLRTALRAWKVWPFDDKAAFEYGRLAAELRTMGRPMQQIDIMSAAIAISLGNCTVVSADSDGLRLRVPPRQPVHGLRVYRGVSFTTSSSERSSRQNRVSAAARRSNKNSKCREGRNKTCEAGRARFRAGTTERATAHEIVRG